MRRSLTRTFRTVVVLWLTLSVASVILAGITWVELSRRLAATREAVALREAVDGTLILLLEIETGERGYTITGHEFYLDPFKRAETELPLQFDRLAEISRSDPELNKEVMDLRAKAETVLVLYRKVVALRRQSGFDAAAKIIETGEGSKAMQEIRRKANQISRMRYDLILADGLNARKQLLRAGLTSLIAGALGIGAGILAFLLERHKRELMVAKVQVERVSQAKSELLANMSHEIRTPMNSILGFSELLESELRDPKHRHYIQSVRSSASSLLQLINDVLDLSKIDAGAMKLRPEPTDPREACEFIQTVFAESASVKGVKLHCHMADDLPKSLLIDRLRLRQILVNLVGNAVKFTDQGRIDINLSWERDERSSHINLLIEVTDTGVGIPEERLSDIFQPFVQAESHRAKERQGSGLGLSIVKRLTEAMDGTISVTSVVGQGSSFRLRFKDVPISARLAASDQDEDGAAVDFNELKPAQILVVDDNEQNRELLAGIFNGTHHRLVFGRNGREAVEKAQEARPDVTLLDIRMPEMNGEVALAAIRRTPGLELMPVIAVTASSVIEQDLTLEEKFNGFLRKPFSRRQLFAELSHFLPRQPKSTAAPHEPETFAIRGDWRDLASQLRRMSEEEWPALRDGLAINESLSFARKLEALGRKTNCRPLLKYAQSISGHAESYAAGPLERQLLEFPALVDQIERAAHD